MVNRLKNLEEFKSILANYEISAESRATLAKTKLVLMLGPSSAGRNTIIKELLKTGEYHFIVSDTTRHKRENNGIMEQDGVDYWFRVEDDFLSDLKAGKYLEAEVIHNQQVSGISIRELEKAESQQKYVVCDIDLKGMEVVVSANPDTLALLVLPPSFEEWQKRLNGRGELPEDEVRRRLETATKILQAGLEHHYFTYIVNDDFHNSVKLIHNIIQNGADKSEQERGRQVINSLIKDTKQFLESNE